MYIHQVFGHVKVFWARTSNHDLMECKDSVCSPATGCVQAMSKASSLTLSALSPAPSDHNGPSFSRAQRDLVLRPEQWGVVWDEAEQRASLSCDHPGIPEMETHETLACGRNKDAPLGIQMEFGYS